jgi:type IV pilus assembly protein PilO
MALSFDKLPLGGKILFGVLANGLVFALFYFLVYSDLSTKVERESKRTNELRKEEAVQEQARKSYFADRDDLASKEAKEKEFNKILPEETEVAGFLSTIQQVTNVAGIDLKSYQPQEEVPQQFYARVPMKLELSGKYHQVTKFMNELGKTDRIINVENIELTDATMVGDEVNLKAKCLATTFHLIKRPATPAPGTPGAPGTPPGATGAPAPGAPPKK